MNSIAKDKFNFEYTKIGDDEYLLKFRCRENVSGLVNKIAGVLFALSWQISRAKAITSLMGDIEDEFLIQDGGEASCSIKKLIEQLTQAIASGESGEEFLRAYPEREKLYQEVIHPSYETNVQLESLAETNRIRLNVKSLNRSGVFLKITSLIREKGLDIFSLEAELLDGQINDTFILGCEDEHLDDKKVFQLRSAILNSI